MKNRSERGSFTIEAILSLSIFMFAFVTIVSLAIIAKVESTTQYAIDQVAKEISQYYYIAQRLGVLDTNNSNNGGVKDIDATIQAVADFSNILSDKKEDYTPIASGDIETMLNNIGNIKDDINEVTDAANKIYSSFGNILENPKGVISALTTMLVGQIKNEVIGKVVAQPLCKVLVPKYITSSGDADAMLKKMGVVNGLDDFDFRMSSFLSDQRSINIVLVYPIKVRGFGVFDRTLVIKQTASTAAWVKAVTLEEANTNNNAASPWQKDERIRGKEYVDIIQKENSSKSVKGGVGVDLYNKSNNTFTSVHSINVFTVSYSSYQKTTSNASDPKNYTLNKSKIKSKVKGYANSLLKNIKKIDENITMSDGTKCQTAKENRKAAITLVVPEDSKQINEGIKTLNEIAAEIQAETGVKVSITYRDNALGGE